MQLGRLGVWTWLDAFSAGDAAAFARKVEAWGYSAQASLRWLGFSDADFQAGGSDRLVDAIVAWGDERTIAARIRAHHDAGADHVCIQPFRPDGGRGPDLRLLEALAPGSGH